MVKKNGKHYKKIIAADLDQTICKGVSWSIKECLNAKPDTKVINKINKLAQSNLIVIYTVRKDFLIPATLKWLRRNDVEFDAISNKKMPVDLLIDDLAIRPEEL